MTTAERLLRYQGNHIFEDTVLKFINLVQLETEVPGEVYKAIWEFADSSKIQLQNETFSSIIDRPEQ